MPHKPPQCGLDLLTVTPEMIHGVEIISMVAKNQGDKSTYLFLQQVKNVLCKYVVLAKLIEEISAMEELAAKALTNSAEYKRQLFPVVPIKKENEESEK